MSKVWLKPGLVLMPAVALLIISCNAAQQQEARNAGRQPETPVGQQLLVGNTPLQVEVVQTDEERMRGLMFREHLPQDQGMLFVFAQPRIQSFWMRNTFIPLDIAFIDTDGIIIDIQHMTPLDEDRNYVSPGPVPYVLEVNAGWFERHQIKVGERVRF